MNTIKNIAKSLTMNKMTRNDKPNLLKNESKLLSSPSDKLSVLFIQVLQFYPQLGPDQRHKYLVELLDYIKKDTVIKHWMSEECVPHLLGLIKISLFRGLPLNSADYDYEADQAWPYLQSVYDILTQFITNVPLDTLQEYLDKTFISNLVHLINSPNPFEREYVKNIIHAIYKRCTFCRPLFITAMNEYFYCIIHSDQKRNGIAELLQILTSIINGFMTPLKPRNVSLLSNILIPMHKVSFLSDFHTHLSSCIMQFISKVPSLAPAVIVGLLRYWPVCSLKKQIIFLEELEQILKIIKTDYLENIMGPLFKQIVKSMACPHSEVSECALFLWSNHKMVDFIACHKREILPILCPVLQSNYLHHWNENISAAALKMTEMLNEMDGKLATQVLENNVESRRTEFVKKQERASKWICIRRMAFQNNNNQN